MAAMIQKSSLPENPESVSRALTADSGRGHDVVQFSKSVFDNFADVLAHASQQSHDVVIDAGDGNSLTLKHTKLAALDKADFHFS